jgi:hypothetical protein
MANILIVDDEPGIRDFMAEALEDRHFTVASPNCWSEPRICSRIWRSSCLRLTAPWRRLWKP